MCFFSSQKGKPQAGVVSVKHLAAAFFQLVGLVPSSGMLYMAVSTLQEDQRQWANHCPPPHHRSAFATSPEATPTFPQAMPTFPQPMPTSLQTACHFNRNPGTTLKIQSLARQLVWQAQTGGTVCRNSCLDIKPEKSVSSLHDIVKPIMKVERRRMQSLQ